MPGNRKQSLQFEDVNTVIILARGEGRGRVRRGGGGGRVESYFHMEIFKCLETARNAAKLAITAEA